MSGVEQAELLPVREQDVVWKLGAQQQALLCDSHAPPATQQHLMSCITFERDEHDGEINIPGVPRGLDEEELGVHHVLEVLV